MPKFVIEAGAIELVRGRPIEVEIETGGAITALTKLGLTVWERDKWDATVAKIKETMDFDFPEPIVTNLTVPGYMLLLDFYNAVAYLTLHHDVLGGEVGDKVLGETAVVYPSKLGPLLEAVDKEWWKRKP
jgi:hypothetical protein